jgi:dolichyl-phosphooligosaccharide-protein glycotransferase
MLFFPSRRWTTLALGVVLLAGLVVRLQPWHDVFQPGRPGARFVADTDTYYHALRAERIAAAYPAIPWNDSGMNYPRGAEILWPPLFDHAIATAAWIATDGHPTRAAIERAAAILPPLIGCATILVVAALAFLLLGGEAWLAATILLALLPIHVEFSVVGRPDQHAAESLLQALVMLAFVAGWTTDRKGAGRWWWAGALGAAIALSFWNWQGSALYLILLAAYGAAVHVIDGEYMLARRVHGALARGAGLAALFLVGSIGLWGRPGALARTTLEGINGIQALLTALVALYAAALALCCRARLARGGPGGRALEVAAAAIIPIAAAWLVLPGVRAGIGQGLVALTAGNPWYASIREFQPPLFGGTGIVRELAAWLPRFAPMFVMPAAVPALLRAWRQRPTDRPALLFLAVWGGLLLIPTLLRLRFTLYLAVPAALWSALALRELADWAGAQQRLPRPVRAVVVIGLAILLLPASYYFAHGGLRPDPVTSEVIRALEWLRARPLPDADHASVFSEWDWGHLIQYFAARPAVATPFGSDGGEGAIEDAAAFFLTRSPAEASRILSQRHARHLLTVDPVTQAAESAPYAPSGHPSPVSVSWHPIRGPHLSVTPEVDDLVAVRIHYDNGLSAHGLPTLDRYRLLYEGRAIGPQQVRLFEIVPAAELRISGAAPDATIRVTVSLRTNQDRGTSWYASSPADDQGRASIRVPFSSGANGAVLAGSFSVDCGGPSVVVAVPAAAVEGGQRVAVACELGAAKSASAVP